VCYLVAFGAIAGVESMMFHGGTVVGQFWW
jgi:hypothetical protein